MTAPSFEQAAAVTALGGLSGMGPARLAAILEGRSAADVWADVRAGRLRPSPRMARALGSQAEALIDGWRREAREVELADVDRRLGELGVTVVARGSARYPARLHDDPEPPEALWSLGDHGLLERPAVGVVGTRHCTRYGLDIAEELGAELARHGVGVVSGLALGIDGAAHRGALAAAPETGRGAPVIAVVGSGVDCPYPREHRDLWFQVAAHGLLLSETPPGLRPQRWRFPARNRIIAGLADVLVVVESHRRGGSLYTVEEALLRDRPVMAVPGPIRSAASGGTNRLLADGAHPFTAPGDVLELLGLSSPGPEATTSRTAPTGVAARVLDAMGWEPASFQQIGDRVPAPLGEIALALDALEREGWVVRAGGSYERRSGSASERA